MNRKLIAVAAAVPIVFGAVFGATPALAAEGDPSASAAEATPAPTAAPTTDPSPDPTTPAPTPVPTDSPAPIATDAPTPDPAPSTAAPTPEPSTSEAPSTPDPASSTEPSPAQAAPVEAVAPAVARTQSAAPRPGPGETGYTTCWELYPDMPDIDPYDARTWGAAGSCGALEDWRSPWTASVHAWNTTTNQSISSGFSDPNAGGSSSKWSATGDAARWGEGGVNSPEDANLAVEPGQNIRITYDLSIQMPTPDTKPIIGLDGNPGYRSIPQINFRMPVTDGSYQDSIPANWDGIRLSANDQSCSSPSLNNVAGQRLLVWCTVDATIDPSYTLDEWLKVRGRLIFFQPSFNYELEWIYPDGLPGGTQTRTLAMPTAARIDPAQTWLPTATDKSFRVKAADTLTVTPSGLLTGAQWSEGNVDELNTYITNVPQGGAVTPQGNLEFTSEQVGDYAFNYYLQDPKTGLRSADATGSIEVYDTAQPSCFAGPPAQAGTSYPDLPDDPAPVRFSGKVGEPLHFTTRDLINGTAWVDSYLRDISQLPGLDYSGPVNDMQLEWTPKEAGVVTLTYALRTQNCASKVYTATIDVAPADAVLVAPPASDPPAALLPAAPLPPAPVAPAAVVTPQLAHTGSNTDGTGIAFIALLAIGLGATAAAVARRRSRPSSPVVGEDK